MILGLHEDSNASAAVVSDDGCIVAAVAEERFTRVKYGGGYPRRAVDWLAHCGALRGEPAALDGPVPPSHDRVDCVVAAGNPFHPIPRVLLDGIPAGQRDFLAPLQQAHVAWHEAIHRSGLLRRGIRRLCRESLQRRFERSVELHVHHTCHAASAYFTAPWPEATVVTCDNLGDGECARAFHGRDGGLELLWSVGAWNSPGQFYGEVASFLGIDPMTAGKVTGLAARGEPQRAAAILRQRLRCAPNGRGFVGSSLRSRRRGSAHWQQLEQLSPGDVAAGAQQVLEDTLIPFVKEAIRSTGCGRLALAGGVFGNVTLNRKLAELAEVEAVWVHPAMSDQGIAVGAALLSAARRGPLAPRALRHVFLGPQWSEAACARALEGAGLQHRPASPDVIAELLERGLAVARCVGRVEYGPRALGNRSILVRPDDARVNDWLNERLERSEYMPFAPVTLAEAAESLYADLEPLRPCLPFMTTSVHVRDPGDPRHAGVVHLDGTARPQVLARGDNPGLHAILRAFERRTGIPSLVNTSFNRHGEPIVGSPEDAIDAWKGARLDALVLGDRLVVRRDA